MRPVRTIIASMGLTVAAVTGCGGDEPRVEGPISPTTSSSGTSATSEPGPTVQPADGKTVQTDVATLQVPRGYDVRDVTSTLKSSADLTTGDIIYVSYGPSFGTTNLDRLARNSISSQPYDVAPKHLPDVTIDEIPAFHIEGQVEDDFYFAEFGAVHLNRRVELSFEMRSSAARSRRVIESVLATWQWK